MKTPERKLKNAEYARKRYWRIKSDPQKFGESKLKRREYSRKNSIAINEKKRCRLNTPKGKKQTRETEKRYYSSHPTYIFTRNLANKFAMTPERYEALAKKQNYCCAICARPETAKARNSQLPRRLAVDHHHETGAIRGLLCARCNQGLGFFGGDVGLMIKGIAYLEKHGLFAKESRPEAKSLLPSIDENRNLPLPSYAGERDSLVNSRGDDHD